MCRPKPYARCTRHALSQLTSIKEELAQTSVLYDRVKHGRNSAEKSKLYAELEKIQARLFLAQKEYNSSPGGIKELEAKLALAKTPRERVTLEGELELAKHSRALHNLAGKNYDRFKENISSDDLSEVLALRETEQALNKELAERKNSNGDKEVERFVATINKAKHRRLSMEESLRRKAAGVDPDNSTKRELGQLSGVEDSWVQIPAQSLGSLRKYLPFGTYAKITKIQRDENSTNYLVELDGAIERLLPASQPVLVRQNI